MSAQQRRVLSLKRDANQQEQVLTERIHKVLANAGLGSRRALEARITEGEIEINDQIATVGTQVKAGDQIKFGSQRYIVSTDHRENTEVLIYNKPEGVMVTRDDEEQRPTVFDDLPRTHHARWIAVGRLDINTTGLLLFTTDGELANALMHPSNEVEREYLCRIHGEVSEQVLNTLKEGVLLDDGPAKFDDIHTISQDASHSWFRVTIREGRNREVRRLWDSQGLLVSRLKRIRYSTIELPRHVRRGDVLPLEEKNIQALRDAVGLTKPSPTLTLSPLSRQRRAHRRVTEIKPQRAAKAWAGGYQDEARELRAFDGGQDRPSGKRGRGRKPSHSRKNINGNVAGKGSPYHRNKTGKKRHVAPGQELPSVRTWFAGDNKTRKKPGNKKRAPSRRNGKK